MIILIMWDMFETYSEPFDHWKIFLDYILESFRLKISKNAFIGLCLLYKGIYYLFEVRNEEFRRLRSEYMTIIISQLFKL